jgi:hypothetical protein
VEAVPAGFAAVFSRRTCEPRDARLAARCPKALVTLNLI